MWLVIGYGNLLREDDGGGQQLAALLAKRLPAAKVRVISAHQLTPELSLEIARDGIERVLFIDATRQQQRPFVLRRLRPEGDKGRCGHQLCPEILLLLAERLFGSSPRAWLLTLPAYATAFGEKLSPPGQEALQRAMECVLAVLDRGASVGPSKSRTSMGGH